MNGSKGEEQRTVDRCDGLQGGMVKLFERLKFEDAETDLFIHDGINLDLVNLHRLLLVPIGDVERVGPLLISFTQDEKVEIITYPLIPRTILTARLHRFSKGEPVIQHGLRVSQPLLPLGLDVPRRDTTYILVYTNWKKAFIKAVSFNA